MKKKLIMLMIALLSIGAMAQQKPITGADQPEIYLPMLKGKKVGIMCNQTSIVGDKHIVDFLLANGVDLRFGFAPEHGFRGNVERGVKVNHEVDEATGLRIHSLYGAKTNVDSIMKSVDVMIFDLQDVGARFYTYITSMDNVMQACARVSTPLIVLDRPNPNGDQVDGPVRKDDKFKSGVSHHKIAMIHGLTIGELAKMINGEKWLKDGAQCDVTIVPVKNYTHSTPYELPVIPSPSLPNQQSVRLYMSLCLFEGTEISVGRGTEFPFEVIGYTNPVFGDFQFTPGSKEGMSQFVEGQNQTCYGVDLRDVKDTKFTLGYLLDFYNKSKKIEGFEFFTRPEFFNKLAGNAELQQQIKDGWNEQQIRDSWRAKLDEYRAMRQKYLIYAE